MKPFTLDNSMISTFGGTFYPTGYTIVLFPKASDAQKVGEQLTDQQIGDGDFYLLSPQEILEQITPTAAGADEPLPSAGTEGANVRAYTALAQDGHAALLVKTEDGPEAKRLMEIVSSVPYSMARRYRALVIEDL